jgi:hypothetical protein
VISISDHGFEPAGYVADDLYPDHGFELACYVAGDLYTED